LSIESLLPFLLRRRLLFTWTAETTLGKIHELTPLLDSFDLVEVTEKEFSLLSAFSRVCFKTFSRALFPG
jgi:hypothetical protein